MSSDDYRQHAPAAARNRGPILDVLRSILPSSGRVLEVASGTGENEICNGVRIEDWEFQTRIGWDRTTVQRLLDQIHEAAPISN